MLRITLRSIPLRLVCAIVLAGTLWAFQKPFREYPGVEYRIGTIPLPPDYQDKTEFAFSRMMFPGGPLDGYQNTGRFTGDYHRGLSLWTQDYPRADRHFLEAVRRLTRLNVRSVEQVVDVEDGDDVYNWPFLYAVQAGEWGLTEAQGKILREYIDRGGFFMADDIHGTDEWEEFVKRIGYAFPESPVQDIPDKDAIFHTVFDMDDRYQVPGYEHLRTGGMKNNGRIPYWRAIYDDKGRIRVAATYNSDLGDSWEFADDPSYPEKYSALGLRLGVNYIIYSITH